MMYFNFMFIKKNVFLAVRFTFVVRIQKAIVKPKTKGILYIIATLLIETLQLVGDSHEHEIVSEPSLFLYARCKDCKAVDPK